jgi:hypothetical protein
MGIPYETNVLLKDLIPISLRGAINNEGLRRLKGNRDV